MAGWRVILPVAELLQDIKFGLRMLGKNPGFTIVALATLAIGIGANTAIFSIVSAVMLKPLPFPKPGRIVRLLEKSPNASANGIAPLNYLDWASQNTVFEFIAAQQGTSATYTGGSEPVQLQGARVSARYFDVLGVKAALGRTFVTGEDQPGGDREVILTHATWVSLFGGDPSVIGRTIPLDGEPHTVIGVLPPGVFDRWWAQVWRPLAFGPTNMTRDFHWLTAFARLKPGVSVEQARAQMDVIGARLAQEHPDTNVGWGVRLDPLADTYVGNSLRQSLYILLGAVGMVLLIGCANIANLMLARSVAREREVAIRAALGAGRGRLVRQFLAESILLSAIGGVLGLAMAWAMSAGIRAAMPQGFLPGTADVRIDGQVLLFALGLSLLTGIGFGLVPALQATRADLMNPLKQGGIGSSAGRARQGFRRGLVVAEVGLAFVLLSGAGLLIRTFFLLQKADPGFESTNVVTAWLPTPDGRYTDGDAFRLYMRQIQAGIAALPGVRDVSLTSALPTQGWGFGMSFQISSEPFVPRPLRHISFFKVVSPSYFHALGIRLLQGRMLNEGDTGGAPPAVLINETMVRKYFPDGKPLGKRLSIEQIVFGRTDVGPEIPWEIVGVVSDEAVGSPGDPKDAGVYASFEQSPVQSPSLVVRGTMDPSLLQRAVVKAVHEVNRDQAVARLKSLDQIRADSVAGAGLGSALMGIFAGIALLLAAIGLYGVISYSVAQRTREIGIRSALGAGPSDILWLVLRSGMALTGVGLLLGLAGAFALNRLLASLLFGVGAHDPITLAAVALALGAAGLLACVLPARRATRINPNIALRYE